jgi:hypothetical protein
MGSPFPSSGALNVGAGRELTVRRAAIGKVVTRKVDRLSCVRFGSARYSVPTVHVGGQVELRIRDGVITMMVGQEVIAEHLVVSLVRPPSSTITTADRDRARCGRCGPRAPTRRRSVLLVRWPMPSSRVPPPEG